MATEKDGILIINWNKKATESTIKDIINSLYKDNEEVISGMSYYETEDKTLKKEIENICEA